MDLKEGYVRATRVVSLLGLAMLAGSVAQAQNNVKMCFVGDNGNNAAPFNYCETDTNFGKTGVDGIIQLGDMDYTNSPSAWENFLNSTVGSNFPVIETTGN